MDNEKRFNLDVEKSLLGQCLNNKINFEKLLNIGIIKEDFYNTEHQKIYEAFINTYAKYGTLDIVLVAKENKNIAISSLSQLFEESVPIDFNAHMKVLIDLSINRQYLNLGKEIQKGIHEDIGDYIKEQAERINLLKSRLEHDNAIITMDQVEIVDIYNTEKIKTGFKDIDKRILGFVTGSLVVITGHNGNGKSTLINQMCIAESLSQGYKVFAYSPELTNSNLKSWLYPTLAIEEHFISKKNYYGEEYKVVGEIGKKALDEWIKDKLYIYSDDSITNKEKKLLSDMEYMAKNKGVRVFIIDNLMKIDLEGSYKNELIAQKEFVNKLKEFARRYNSVVHLVCHLKKPQQGNSGGITKYDISGSLHISDLADYVIAIKRVSEEEKQDPNTPPGLKDCILKVIKDRPRGTGDFYIDLNFDKDRKRFYAYKSELDKDYGYIGEITQVEIGESPF